jgi:hypothetical protein
MNLSWSIDDVVRISDEDAVRRRFAQRNRVWLAFLFIFFAFASLIAAVDNDSRKTPIDVLVAVGNLAVIAFGFFVLRYAAREELTGNAFLVRAGAWLRAHSNATALAYSAAQYTVSLFLAHEGDNFLGWIMTFPLIVLGFRMLVPELVLLHGYLVAGALVMTLLGGEKAQEMPIYISMIVINAGALATELYMSRRMRRDTISEWTSRRTQAREQVRMRDELRYARELQLSMLPECAPDLEWADICSISVPATEVGGDYYDYFVDEPNQRVALVCMDVAGHGMASGLVLAALRSGFTLLRDSLHDPAAVLQRLHTLVAETSRRRMLVTVSVVLLDRTNQTATIASAGNPPIFVRRSDGMVETINLYAPPLGVRLPVDIPQRRIDVRAGDVIVLHSDGIYETRSADDDVYGLDRIARIIQEQGGGNAEALRDALLDDVAEFRGTREQDDDITLVVCRLT